MISIGIILIEVFCFSLQSKAQSTNASLSATPTLSDSTVTIEIPSSVFSSKVVEPSKTTSIQSDQNSVYVNSLLNDAKKLINDARNGVDEPKGECDGLDWKPIMQACSTTECRETYADEVNKLIKCLGNKPENVSSFDLAAMIENVGDEALNALLAKVNSGDVAVANASYLLVRDTFALGSGAIDGLFVNTTKEKYLSLPDYSKTEEYKGQFETVRDLISVPIELLKALGGVQLCYIWSIFPELIEDRPLMITEIETDYNQIIRDSDVSELYIDNDGVLKSTMKVQNVFINSNIIGITLKLRLVNLKYLVLITLRHKRVYLEKPFCVFWDNTSSIWSRKGCQIYQTNSTHTICACNHLTMFAVAMKEKIIEDLSDRESVVTTAIVFGVLSILLLAGSAFCIFFVGYHIVDNMRIALNLEVALLFCNLFFFIGLSNNSSKYAVTPATCDVISPFLHMFELAALTFLLMEGFFYVERFTVVFNKKNTRTLYIYMALGWGLPIAFAAACAGYSYPHYGSPKRNEFCWMSVYGRDAWFFGAPLLILVLLNLIVRGVVLEKVLKWKGNPDDINIDRARHRLISSIVLLPVIILTWLFGIIATNHSDEKVYHYFFIIFQFLQGFLVFIFYCARNTEMWEYYKDKKEKILAEKNAVYHFNYVP